MHFLTNLAAGKPYLEVAHVDLDDRETFNGLEERFDTVVCLNVLEHVPDPARALGNIWSALEPGGRLVLYVPRGANLYSSLDDALDHRCRYEVDMLTDELTDAGFTIEHLELFNRLGVFGWWFNGKIRKKRHLSRVQLKMFDMVVPIVRRIDRFLPWRGLGIVAAARKPLVDVASLSD